jgi:hypothetical protein
MIIVFFAYAKPSIKNKADLILKPLFWDHLNPYYHEHIRLKTVTEKSREDARDHIKRAYSLKSS